MRPGERERRTDLRLVSCLYHEIVLWYDAENLRGVHLEFHPDGAGGYRLHLFPSDLDWLGKGERRILHARNQEEALAKAIELLGARAEELWPERE